MTETTGAEVRKVAIQCVLRIEESQSYANIIVPTIISSTSLGIRDRKLVTEIVYGSTRMKKALDWAFDRYLPAPPPPALRASLRVGTYQILFMRVPDHAAVNATVSASSKRNKGVVNAVLRKITREGQIHWPNDPTRLSYPDWILELLSDDLGTEQSVSMLEHMNYAPEVSIREDGYHQDRASQWVIDLMRPEKNDLVLDLCAAPGGKSTALARQSSLVIAADINPSRQTLISQNLNTLGLKNVFQVISDGTSPPFPTKSFDKVLVDAPCSGLGVLHRRPDARWRISKTDVSNLAKLQKQLLSSASKLVKPGGKLVYSVCTVTRSETIEVAQELQHRHPELEPIKLTDTRWRPNGNGLQILPQDSGTDGMSIFQWTV
ncbi:MAG TPA: transcription antitermination factor NusB [Acidimicrobiales bacterium]|nr:transcription antitermination factor NusB [Acidimicrobiales bacterium]